MARRRSKKNNKKLNKKIIQSKNFKINRKASEMNSQEEETKSKRRTRMNFSEEQICYLEDFFGNTSHYPDIYQREGEGF